MVERGPEKAGVGGSIPSLATIQKYEQRRDLQCAVRSMVTNHIGNSPSASRTSYKLPFGPDGDSIRYSSCRIYHDLM